ncbi:MAG: polysaccharide deacetylase family protein [Leptospirales bacterium]|nr:polysaccharide deacetylase family protein [Leptospirales bacterium]
MKALSKTALAVLLLAAPVAANPPASSQEGARVYVLCYHTFLGRSGEYDTSPQEFGRQMDELATLGYRFVSYPEMLAGQVSGSRNVLISIDDGNRSLLSVYQNVLRRHSIKPLLFIYPGIIDKADYALTFPELKNIQSQGASFGSHGYFHLFLNQKTHDRSPTAFHDEFHRSKRILQERLGIANVDVFAFPFGVTSDLARAELRRAGYRYAFTIFHGQVRVPLDQNSDPLRLPRYMVTKESWRLISGILRRNARQNDPSHADRSAADRAVQRRPNPRQTAAEVRQPRSPLRQSHPAQRSQRSQERRRRLSREVRPSRPAGEESGRRPAPAATPALRPAALQPSTPPAAPPDERPAAL